MQKVNELTYIDASLEILEKAKKHNKNFDILMNECYELIMNTKDEKMIQAYKLILKSLYDGDLDPEKVFEIMKEKLGVDLANELEKPIFEWTKSVYMFGLGEVSNQVDVKLSFTLTDKKAVDIMSKHNIFFIGEYYDHNNGNVMKNEIAQMFAEAVRTDQMAEKIESLLELDKKLSTNYFEGFVEHATSRIRNVSNIAGYEKAGIEYAEVVAIMDDLTSDICLEMNGRLIPVRQMIKIRDDILSIQTDDRSVQEIKNELKEIVPFWKDKDTEEIKGKDTIEILDLHPGLALPPYHWRCRTQTIAYFDENETE